VGEVDQQLGTLLDRLLAVFPQADSGAILLSNGHNGRRSPVAVRHRRRDGTVRWNINHRVADNVMKYGEAVLLSRAAAQPQSGGGHPRTVFPVRSIVCAPLRGTDGQVLGALQLETRDQRTRFGNWHLEVLARVAAQAAVVVENHLLRRAALQEKELQRQLSMATDIQKSFLPGSPPEVAGYEFFNYYRPAKYLSGDYFDYILLPDERLAVVMADVSGKGIPAALVMSNFVAQARFHLARNRSPADAVTQLNDDFTLANRSDRFITLVVGVLDPRRHEVTVVNAGHMPPLVRRAEGETTAVGAGVAGLPIGVVGGSRYESCVVALEPGSCLAVYTDGVTEAMNAKGDLYGKDRLVALVSSPSIGDAGSLGKAMLNDLDDFVGAEPQADDTCVCCLGRAR
jgi:serine phosphatase RsbU (regulator of sigma subunit)